MRAVDTMAVARHIISLVVGGSAQAFEKHYFDLVNNAKSLEAMMPTVRERVLAHLQEFLRRNGGVVAASSLWHAEACEPTVA